MKSTLSRNLIPVALGLFVAFVAAFSNAVAPASGADLTLAENGKSAYRIVLPAEPTPVQRSAANELKSFFEQATDADLPVVSEADVADANADANLFVIGPSDLSKKLLGNAVDESKIDYDGIIIKRVGNSIVLSGHSLRGSLYAVYEFLERALGCRWWTATESTIPRSDVVKVAGTDDGGSTIDVVYAPKLEYRESYYRGAFDGPFAARSKCNGNGEPVADELGGHHRFQYFVHSSFVLIPPQRYFLEHPDWFAEIDGVRKIGWPGWAGTPGELQELYKQLKPEQIHNSGTQLCFTNDEMLAEMAKNALEALRANPKASFLSISQNDWQGYCTCEKCRKLDEEAGTHAASLMYGVNKIAEAVEKEFPNVYVETLAYQYTRKAPKPNTLKPRKNVVVRLCSIECSFVNPLFDDQNASFRDDVVGWSQTADKLFVWDYVTDFALYLLPFPNYRVLAPNINFYIDRNVVGLFEQGDYQCETGDFVQLRNWVVSKLLWDPSQDPKALVDEFIAGYYAPELVPVYRKYFDVLSDAAEKSGVFLGIYKTSTTDWLDLDSLDEATRLQNEALAIAKRLEADRPERFAGLVSKVRREQIPLDLVWLQEYRRAFLRSKLTGKEFLGPADPQAAARAFVAKLDEFGLTRSRESDSPDSFQRFKTDLIDRFDGFDPNAAKQAPDVCKDAPADAWLDVQEFDLNKGKLGEWTFVEKDAAASNGRAVKMPGTHFEWATSWNVPAYLAELKSASGKALADGEAPKYRAYAFVRCDASVDDGSAMTLGVYDEKDKKNVAYRDLSVAEIKGSEYKTIDLGEIELKPAQYFWFAPPKRPGEVDAVYVDRIVLVRE